MVRFLFFIFALDIYFAYADNVPFYIVQSTTEPPTDGLLQKMQLQQTQIQEIQQRLNSTCITDEKPKNCKEVQKRGHQNSGIYYIQPLFALRPFPVLCNMKTDGGGWTYILNRFDGSQEFYMNWKSYKEGFGNLAREFWLGLEKIHLLTGYQYNELLIELVFHDSVKVSARYNTFTVGNEQEGYILRIVEGYSGDAGDYLTHVAGMQFTTKDKDQDVWFEGNCADWSYAGWWYKSCKHGHLTGKYLQKNVEAKGDWKEIYWGKRNDVKEARMMVRPRLNGDVVLYTRENF